MVDSSFAARFEPVRSVSTGDDFSSDRQRGGNVFIADGRPLVKEHRERHRPLSAH